MPAAASPARALRSEDIRAHYDDFSWAYRLYWGDHLHHGLFLSADDHPEQAQEQMLEHCARLAGVRPEMEVLDVGCGHGGTARYLASRFRCTVTGLTISPVQQKLAAKLAGTSSSAARLRFEVADAERYSYPPRRFDLIWNMESTEHFFDKPGYFHRAAGALKPGGVLMISAWTGSMEDDLVRTIAGAFLCPQLLNSEQYAEAVRSAGLQVTTVEDLTAAVAPTWDHCSEQAHIAAPLLTVLPAKFRSFAAGIELMREGYRTGRLRYTVLVAKKED